MTNEQAIKAIKANYPSGGYEDLRKALEMAIKSLEQEPILDKIRTEIKAMFPPSGSWMYDEGHEIEHTVCEVLADVLKIIDKYKAKMEGAEE